MRNSEKAGRTMVVSPVLRRAVVELDQCLVLRGKCDFEAF